MTTTRKLLDRKEIATMIDAEVTVEQVIENEERWGLLEAKVYLNKRCVRYRALIALRNLKKLGILE